MTIFPIIGLAIILVCIAIFLVIALSIIWHLFKYGVQGDSSKTMAVIFVIIAVLLMVLAFIAYANIDWDAFSTTF